MSQRTKIRLLTDVIPMDQRPKCACCGNPLRPRVSWIETPPDIEEPPSRELAATFRDARVIDWGEDAYHPDRVYRSEVLYHGQKKWWHYWVGKFEGYGPFCTLRCAEAFAKAAYNAGYRIKRN